jgi:hypothetical protein
MNAHSHYRKFLLCMGLCGASASATPVPINLYASFTIAAPGTFGDYSIPLLAADWHVGSVAGPTPTAAEFSSVLATISGLQIGGNGHATSRDFATVAYEFELTNPGLAGLVSDTFASFPVDWTVPARASQASAFPALMLLAGRRAA